jgi:L-fuculose-phosphate aldolase
MDTGSPAGLRAVRAELVAFSARLLDDGLAIGTAGNLSVRLPGGEVAITPSGVGYRDLRPDDICLISPTGHRTALAGQELAESLVPSSEAPMHLAIYAATGARAIVHTHSAEVIALSAGCDELPAIHYAITGLGGPVRVAPYARFGSDDLAGAAARALTGRQAAILRNHGAVCCGRTLAEAYDRALLLEWLARVYRLARSYGLPSILTAAELADVTAEMRRRRYGEPVSRQDVNKSM